jgi:hypothetical protein
MYLNRLLLCFRMIESYRALLTSEIELDVQNWAIKTLEKELQKVNGLPQILPILRYFYGVFTTADLDLY